MKNILKVIIILILFFSCVSVDQVAQDSLLWDSIEKGDMKRVKKSLEIGADVNGRDNNGNTALMQALLRNEYEMATLFINKGADVNIRNVVGETALMITAQRNQIEMAKLLIEHKADVNIKSRTDATALKIATEGNNTEMIKLLKANGAEE